MKRAIESRGFWSQLAAAIFVVVVYALQLDVPIEVVLGVLAGFGINITGYKAQDWRKAGGSIQPHQVTIHNPTTEAAKATAKILAREQAAQG